MCKIQQHTEATAESWTPQAPLLTHRHSHTPMPASSGSLSLYMPSFTKLLNLDFLRFLFLRIQKSGNGNQVAVLT